MKTQSILYLGIATVVVALIAVFAVQRREAATAATPASGKLFPELAEAINDVRQVEIADADGRFTMERQESGEWGLVEKQGYPVDGGRVRSLLLALRGAVLVERKTSRPELYPELGVEPLEAPEAESRVVRVEDREGRDLASLIVGQRREARGGGLAAQYYVRKPEEASAWLVDAELDLPAEASDWLDKQILDLPPERVQAVRIEHADGETLYVLKRSENEGEFEIVDLPEDREPRYAGAAGSLAGGLANLTMTDVEAPSEVELPETPNAVATFWTFDGLRVRVSIFEPDPEEADDPDEPAPAQPLYARVEAEFDGSGAPGAKEAGPPPPPSGTGEEEGEPGTEESDEDSAKSPEEVQEEAETIHARVTDWVYVLPSWKKSTFAKRLDELTQEIAPETTLEPLDTEGIEGNEEPDTSEDGEEPAADEAAPPPGEGVPGEGGDGGDTPEDLEPVLEPAESGPDEAPQGAGGVEPPVGTDPAEQGGEDGRR